MPANGSRFPTRAARLAAFPNHPPKPGEKYGDGTAEGDAGAIHATGRDDKESLADKFARQTEAAGFDKHAVSLVRELANHFGDKHDIDEILHTSQAISALETSKGKQLHHQSILAEAVNYHVGSTDVFDFPRAGGGPKAAEISLRKQWDEWKERSKRYPNDRGYAYAAEHGPPMLERIAELKPFLKKKIGKSSEIGTDMNFIDHYAPTADTLIWMGGEVKNLGEGKFGGYGVLFTTPHDPDLTEDYFSAKTDLDLEDNDRRSLYYNHGLDPVIGNRKIGTVTVRKDDVGLWVDAQLNARETYASAVIDLIGKQALGFSSGAVSHLVRRERVGKSTNVSHISHWPVGEISITPCPAEPRTLAVPLKVWAGLALYNEETLAAETPVKAAVSISTVRELEDALRDAGYSIKDSKTLVSRFSLRDVENATETSDTFRGDALLELARSEIARARTYGVAL